MPVVDGGITYGCTAALEAQGRGIKRQGEHIERHLRGGGTITDGAQCVIDGVTYVMRPITGLSTNGTSSSQSALASAVSASRSGNKTLLILPPHSNYYRYTDLLSLSENTYIVGYGARIKPLAVDDTAWVFNDNSGMFGMHMDAIDASYTRYLERHESSTGFTGPGSKDGSVTNALDPQGGNNDDAWTNMFGKTNCIMMDVQTRGSPAGAVRCTSNNVLIENCSAFRTHSDSFHVFKIAANVTVRRCHALESGDDGFSMIQYSNSAGAARPSNILIEECEVSGSRTRGMTAVSGKDILFLRCIATKTARAPFMAATTGGHSIAHCEGIKFVECQAWRGSKLQTSATDSAAFLATWSSGSHSWGVSGTEVRNCKARWFTSGNRPDFYSQAIRITASAGTVETPTQSGNDFAAIVSSQ